MCLFLQTPELGVTEHIAEDSCKFAVWTGKPPQSEDKRVIKVSRAGIISHVFELPPCSFLISFELIFRLQARSLETKQLWVKELREVIQQFQFGTLRERSKTMCICLHSTFCLENMRNKK